MASAKCLVAAETFRQKYHSDWAGGTRAVFILASLATLPSEDVVSRRSISLSDEDKNILSKGLGLPPDHWSEQEAIVARYAQDESASIGPQEIFTQQNDMSCHSVLAKLSDFLKTSTDKDGGKNYTLAGMSVSSFIFFFLQLLFTILAMEESFEATGASVTVTLPSKT